MSYKWNAADYIAAVENSTDPGLQEYQRVELAFVKDTQGLADKIIVDVGAGYGRVLPKLAPLVNEFIAVEQDPDELEELRRRVALLSNASLVVGSGNKLDEVLPTHIDNPLVLSLQNTLGPWDGNREVAIQQLARIANRDMGGVIVSLFCREALEDWGIPMYATASRLVGNYNVSTSNLAAGDFRTDTGYESHWFSAEEREAIKQLLGGILIREAVDHKYHIFHISFAM